MFLIDIDLHELGNSGKLDALTFDDLFIWHYMFLITLQVGNNLGLHEQSLLS